MEELQDEARDLSPSPWTIPDFEMETFGKSSLCVWLWRCIVGKNLMSHLPTDRSLLNAISAFKSLFMFRPLL